MRLSTIALAACIALTACKTPEQIAQKTEDMYRDMDIARKHFNDAHKQACIAVFNRNMNDPSSFQLAGDFYLDDIYTQTWYGVTWDNGPARRVVYSARIRGKNAYGALVLNDLRCMLGVTEEGLTLFSAKTR